MILQNYFILQTLEDLRPLMRTGITKLGLPPTEPMNIESMEFAQGAPPVIVKASFSNVVVKGLSNFITNFIEVDPTSRWENQVNGVLGFKTPLPIIICVCLLVVSLQNLGVKTKLKIFL